MSDIRRTICNLINSNIEINFLNLRYELAYERVSQYGIKVMKSFGIYLDKLGSDYVALMMSFVILIQQQLSNERTFRKLVKL